jgi:hypothetical protein
MVGVWRGCGGGEEHEMCSAPWRAGCAGLATDDGAEEGRQYRWPNMSYA